MQYIKKDNIVHCIFSNSEVVEISLVKKKVKKKSCSCFSWAYDAKVCALAVPFTTEIWLSPEN